MQIIEMAETHRILFSFSLYGDQDKYTKGMIANCKIIKEKFPGARVNIYLTNDVPTQYSGELATYSHVKLVIMERKTGTLNTYDRFLAIDEADIDVVFFRDADSRINARDISCIEDFLNGNKALHIIRDHKWHQKRIMAGMFGIRKSLFPYNMEQLMRTWVAQNSANNYGCEELFLGTVIYSLLHNSMLVHSRYRLFQEETLSPFRSPIVNGDFIGQTHNFDANGNVTLQYPENV